MCRCECQNIRKHASKKDYVWNSSTCTYENGEILESVIGNLVITCDEIREVTKTVPTKIFSISFYIFLAFLLITISLLIILSICCFLVKDRLKQEHFLPYYYITNIMKKLVINLKK